MNPYAFELFGLQNNQLHLMRNITELESMIVKEAQTQFPVHELLRRRWSARSFSEQPIAEEVLHTLLEAASWAPSSMNEQPWVYLFAHKGDAAYERMAECLMTGNRWAAEAPLMLLSLARKNFSSNNQPNRHALHDVGAANANLLLQAASLDIYGHQMGGFHMEQTIESFNLAPDLEPVCFIALGYLDEPGKLDEPFRTREVTPRSRKSITAFSRPA